MLVLLGDSHSNAINFGYERLSRREKFLFLLKFGRLRGGSLGAATNCRRNFFMVVPDRIYLTGAAAKRQAELLANRDPFFAVDDRRYFIFSLGFHHPIYKSAMWRRYTIDPSDKKKRFISHAMFREMVLHEHTPILDLYRGLRKLGVGFIVIASPPPSHASFVATTKAAVSSEEFIALFERTRAVFAEELDKIGVRYFFPPKSVTNPNGFLRGKLRAGFTARDHHANGQYGKLFLRHILSNVRTADFYEPGRSVWRTIKGKLARALQRMTGGFDKKPVDSSLERARKRGAAGHIAE
jgi:hypothetical protein